MVTPGKSAQLIPEESMGNKTAPRSGGVLRTLANAWMDLLSALGFLAVWLWRDHFDYDTLRGWLWWPVVLEMFVAFALAFAGMLASLRVPAIRHLAFVAVACAYLAAAWLAGEAAGMPQVTLMAAWLLVARVLPPAGLRFGTSAHQQWVFRGAGLSGVLWGAGFVLTMPLMLVFSDSAGRDADGELRSTSPSWIFPLVWTPYFIAEAVLRAWRKPR
jgi:hypothetical protein